MVIQIIFYGEIHTVILEVSILRCLRTAFAISHGQPMLSKLANINEYVRLLRLCVKNVLQGTHPGDSFGLRK